MEEINFYTRGRTGEIINIDELKYIRELLYKKSSDGLCAWLPQVYGCDFVGKDWKVINRIGSQPSLTLKVEGLICLD